MHKYAVGGINLLHIFPEFFLEKESTWFLNFMLDIKLYMAFSNEVSESFGSGNLAVLNPYVSFSLLEAFLLSWCIAVHLSRLANFSHCSISFFVNVHLLASGMFFIEYLHSSRSMVFMDTGIKRTESARPVQLGAYQMYMWQMSSVFFHESAQRNDAGHLIRKNVFKTTRSFCYQWFRVSTLQANATKHGKKQL